MRRFSILFTLGVLTNVFQVICEASRPQDIWFDMKQTGRASIDTKAARDILVMGDLPSSHKSQTDDYFSNLQFDASGRVVIDDQIALDDLLENNAFFDEAWSREESERLLSDSQDLSSSGRNGEALSFLDSLQPSSLDLQVKTSYYKVQNLTVLLRGDLATDERRKRTNDLKREIEQLVSYSDSLSEDDKELVNDMLFHAEVQVQESNKDLQTSSKVSPKINTSGPSVSSPAPTMSARSSASSNPSKYIHSKPSVVNPPVPRVTSQPSQTSSPSKSRLSDRNPIMKLSIKGPQDIGQAEAEIILKGIGLMTSRRGFQKSLQGLYKGSTYKSNPNAKLDNKMKGFLFNEYRLMRKALEKYSDKPNISQSATPKLYQQWMQKASMELKALGSQRERYALLKSLMTQESGRTHWRNFVPVMGYTADIGFGQFLPATAKSININPYDPEENMRGIAIYLNKLIKNKGLRNGLAAYNGGNYPPPKSFRYADSIMSRLA